MSAYRDANENIQGNQSPLKKGKGASNFSRERDTERGIATVLLLSGVFLGMGHMLLGCVYVNHVL